MIESPQTLPSEWVGDEMVGCRPRGHRDEATGIYDACAEDWPVSSQCSDTDKYGRADHTRKGARYMYNSVCHVLAGPEFLDQSLHASLNRTLRAGSITRAMLF